MRSAKRTLFLGLAATVLALAAFSAAWLLRPHTPRVCVAEQRTGKTFYCTAATQGLKIRLGWIHSVEHEPWTETYRLQGRHFVLDEITLKGYGAGVPANPGGVTTIENGVVHVRHIAKRLPYVRWVHSHDTKHTVTIGRHRITTRQIPHHTFVELVIKE